MQSRVSTPPSEVGSAARAVHPSVRIASLPGGGVASDQRLRSFSGTLLPLLPSPPSLRDDSSFRPSEMRVRHLLPPPPRHGLMASILTDYASGIAE